MNDASNAFGLFMSGVLIGGIFSSIISISAHKSEWREQAIERGYGQYCPDNGYWAWKGECEK